LNPTDPKAYSNRALARLDKDDLQGALDDCDAAIKLAPLSYAPYLNRGIVKSKLGDPEGSRADIAKAIALNPDAQKFLNVRGITR
jgi:tetratricopeptide (TPR) repeat protein